jgi:glycosyltransferase involved in cell wall biosynthesis
MKFAFITPRYGADVSTGIEHACRLLAEQVSRRHDVEVLTTCGRDPRGWKNEYSEGVDRVRGALVRRFAITQGAESLQMPTGLPCPPIRSDELDWVKRTGPWSPGLLDHLKRQHRSYDVIVFFSLANPLTIHGLQVSADRSVLFPHLRLQPELRFGLFAEAIAAAGAIGYLSASERRLLRSYVRAAAHHEEIVGIGIDPSPEQSYPKHQQDPADAISTEDDTEDADEPEELTYLTGRGVPFRRRHRLYGPFVLYGGRVEPDNGSEEMLEYFDTYAAGGGDMALVLMGVKMMRIPDDSYIRLAGVLPERERMIAYEAAEVTIAPASDDLTAQSVLESFAVGTPVLACARNQAAVEHCRRANAGLYYSSRDEFVEALRLMTTNSRLRERLSQNGRSYIRQHYRWDAVLGRFDRLVSRVRTRN